MQDLVFPLICSRGNCKSSINVPESKLAAKDLQERQKPTRAGVIAVSLILPLLHLAIPAFDTVSFASNRDV
jgi:hypothetical protein